MSSTRARRIVVGAVLLLLALRTDSTAATLCHAAAAPETTLAKTTAAASGTFLDAAGQFFLALRALDAGEDFGAHASNARQLLDRAVHAYREALSSAAEVGQADGFLRERPYDRLQRSLGITPGTVNAARWEAIVKIARQSRTPTADLIGVCIAGAESLKYSVTSLAPDMPGPQARRAAYKWHMVLSHGALVSDAFDPSMR